MRKILSSSVFIIAFATYVVFRPHFNASSTGVAVSTTPNAMVVTNVPTKAQSLASEGNTSAVSTVAKKKVSQTVSKKHMHTMHMHRGPYIDGTYTGPLADAYYERVQVRVVIQNGMLKKVSLLPFQVYNGTSQAITSYAMPRLRLEALAVQSAKVNNISGATEISNAFKKSLSTALLKAT